MKFLIKKVQKFFVPDNDRNVEFLEKKIDRLEKDLTMFDYNWYQIHLEKGEDTSTLDMLKAQAEFQIVNHLELLCQAKIHRLRKRILLFMISMLILILIYTAYEYSK